MVKEDIKTFKEKELIHDGEGSSIYRLTDGRLLKVVKPVVIQTCRMIGTSYEDKILSTAARPVKEIVTPLSAVYDGSYCNGFTMEEVFGVPLSTFDDKYSLAEKSNLNKYAELYSKIEEVVMKANKLGIIFPDLCTCDNIIILPDGSLKFIDYDGLVLGPSDAAIGLSTSLGDPIKYIGNRKYDKGFLSFNSELDKTGLAILMFLMIFNTDLTKIGMRNPLTGEIVTLNNVFKLIGINDKEFLKKIEANISSTHKGYYLQHDLFRIAEMYNMVTFKNPLVPDMEIKKLIRK